MFKAPTDEIINSSGGGFQAPSNEVLNQQPRLSVFEGAKQIIDQNPAYKFNPLMMFNKAYGQVNELAGQAGEKLATGLAKQGTNPYVAAATGAALQMAPDVATSILTPMGSSGEAVDSAVPFARRALGFQKSLLKTPFARGQATKAARIALENKIIPYSGNPLTMFDRASNLANKTGQKIGEIINKVPANFESAMDSLELLKNNLAQGTIAKKNMHDVGGIYSGVNNQIDMIKNTITELASQGKNLSASAINKLKNRVGNSINYLSDLASQSDNKAIVNNLANSIRESVKLFTTPEEFADYLSNQKLYSASQLMLKGLNNEIAGQMGNMPASLPSVIAGAGKLATGNFPGAIATTGIFEGLKRRGAGMTARTIQDVGSVNSATGTLLSIPSSKVLNENKAREYFNKANGDKNLARQMAKKDGWQF